MFTQQVDSLPRFWGLRAALAGTLACGLGALLGTSRYLALPGAMRLSWSWDHMPLAIALFVLVGGVSVGVCVGGATLLMQRRDPLRLMGAGALGGILAGVAPGVLGVAGFGSLDAPYAGTANILGSCLVGAIAFVALWSPQLFPRRSERSLLRQLGTATVASVISLGAFGMMGWTLMRMLNVVPTLHGMTALARAMGLVPFAVVCGVVLTAVGGAAIGAACGLVGRMSR
ncbi:hypothetical protein OEB96_06870 [Paraliomyxa miuraensis]|nr:hypothetical protein [Paraliomyxa miuraensis]